MLEKLQLFRKSDDGYTLSELGLDVSKDLLRTYTQAYIPILAE